MHAAPTSKPYTGPGAAHNGSLAASVDFPAFAIISSHLSMGLSWSGTPTGTLKLQHSFDGTTWYDTPGADAEFTAQPAGAPGGVAVNWYNMPGTVARLVYTSTGGTGTLTSYQAQAHG